MSRIERRRVQRTGSSSFIITLPKEWVEAVKLKSGDYVIVEKLGNKLIITPPSAEPSQLKITIKVHPTVTDVAQVFRSVLGAYTSGYNIIAIVFDKSTTELAKYISDIKNLIRAKLPGIEVIEETYNSVMLKVLLNIHELPLMSAIRRLHLIVNSMLQDSINMLKTGDLGIAYGIIQRDDEADRFHHMIVRELSTALLDIRIQHELGITNITEILSYRIIARNLERIADHVVNIAKRVLAVNGLKNPELVNEFLLKDAELFNKAMNALYTCSRREAEDVISESRKIVNEIEDTLYNKVLVAAADAKEKVTVTLILDGVKRIARYSNGIAEAVLNIKVAKTSELDVK
ncbi:MAG: PhoU domain-containing protein [Desulfurococcaceae archaeon]